MKVVHRRRLVWDTEKRRNEMCTQTQATIQTLIFFYPNCTQQVFFETFFFLFSKSRDRNETVAIPPFSIEFVLRPAPTHFFSCIELPNRSLLDNWGNLPLCGLTHIIWKSQSYIFNALPDKRGCRQWLFVCLCVISSFLHLGVVSPSWLKVLPFFYYTFLSHP